MTSVSGAFASGNQRRRRQPGYDAEHIAGNSSYQELFDGLRIDRRPRFSLKVQQELTDAIVGAVLGQLLEIEHFSDGHPDAGDGDGMPWEAIALGCLRDDFDGIGVEGDGRDILPPQPSAILECYGQAPPSASVRASRPISGTAPDILSG